MTRRERNKKERKERNAQKLAALFQSSGTSTQTPRPCRVIFTQRGGQVTELAFSGIEVEFDPANPSQGVVEATLERLAELETEAVN